MGIWLIIAGSFLILEAAISLCWLHNDKWVVSQAARFSRIFIGISVVVSGVLWQVHL